MSPIPALSRKTLCSTLFTAIIVLIFSSDLWARERTIAVFPFEIHGTEDAANMDKAVTDMFSSRLGKISGYTTVDSSRIKAADADPANMNLENALATGRQLDADIVLYGSLTMLGESWSMDTSLADVAGRRLVDTFSRSGAAREELIPGIEAMAKDMEKALKDIPAAQESGSSGRVDKNKDPRAGFKTPEHARKDIAGAWSGPEMDKNFIGIAAADITGNGEAETVLLDQEAVYIYKISGKDFILEEKIDAPFNTKCLAVDTADINENQRAEIFVTAKNSRSNMLRSFILEYKEGAFEFIVEKSPWFYRIVRDSSNSPILLGQRHKTGATPFSDEIFRLTFENNQYMPASTFIQGSTKTNVLGFAPGQIQRDKEKPEAIAFDDRDHLMLAGEQGRTIWKSNRKYGGTSLFLEGPTQGKGEMPKRFYLPGRIIVSTMDTKRSVPDRIFLFNNSDLSPVSLKRVRVYKTGEILGMRWDGAGLMEQWKTRKYDGHFRDICLADLTGDGSTELAALLTEKQSWTPFSESRSRVLVFPIQDTVK
ncbi:MAG: hypothetical protein ACOCR8_03355 [Desulfosalsimonas sp.]